MGNKGKVAHVQPRHVAVAVAYRRRSNAAGGANLVEVCLVSSRKHDSRWVLPKGGIEEGESEAQAAVRELWEEAGVKVPSDARTRTQAHSVADQKPHKKSPAQEANSPAFIPRAIYTGVEIAVGEIVGEGEWPEKDERQREWVPLSEARDRIAWRSDIWKILGECEFP